MQTIYQRIGFILLVVYIFFLVEFILYNFIGPWLKPNLLLLTVIFMTLFFGVRYGLCAAVIAGLLKDCYSSSLFGLYTFSFILCAYATVLIKQYFYQIESGHLRTFLVFLVSMINILAGFTILSMFDVLNFHEAVTAVLIPEVIATTVLASFVFDGIQKSLQKLVIK